MVTFSGDSIHIKKLVIINKDSKVLFEGKSSVKANNCALPKEFYSESALVLYKKLRDSKILDDNNQPLCSKPRAALLAQELSAQLNIKHHWTYYEKMWHRENMRNDLQKAMERKETGDYIYVIREALK